MLFTSLTVTGLAISAACAIKFQPLKEKPGLIDSGTFGPEVEVVHLFQTGVPVGITVSKSGRAFVTFSRGDLTQPYTLAELDSPTTEVAFPNLEINTPPGGLLNTSSGRTLSSSDSEHLISAQAAVLDGLDRLWVLDRGRPSVLGDNILAVVGGPKLMGFDIEKNTTKPFMTITFPETVLPPTGYLNDVRFDLRPKLTKSGKGVAYITDSGGLGIVVVDLGTGKSWRHLDRLHPVSSTPRFLPTFFGVPTYAASPLGPGLHYELAGGAGGCDGLAISEDGDTIYFSPVASRDFYSVDAAALRVNPADDYLAFIHAANTVRYLGEFGGQSDGFETDTNGLIYVANAEHNSINTFDPRTGLISPFVRSPIIAWPDTLSVADDGHIYATVNQLWLSAGFQNGTDKRVLPTALIRAKIQGGRVRHV